MESKVATMALRVIFKANNGKAANDVFARFMSTAGSGSGKRVGFIGLGNMGGFMVKNLLKKVCLYAMGVT